MNLHLILIILICHCPMVRVSLVSALTRQSKKTRQKVHNHIEACHVTAALSQNLLEIRRAKFDSHHPEHVKEAPQRNTHDTNRCVIIQRMHNRNVPYVFGCSKILTSRVE